MIHALKYAKTEREITNHIHGIMSVEIPKLKKLAEVLEALADVDTQFNQRFKAQQKHHEETTAQAIRTALEEQRTAFEKRLAEADQGHQQQLIDMHGTIGKLQDMIDKTYQQNELLLEAQKNQAKGYESQLFNLLEKLKNES